MWGTASMFFSGAVEAAAGMIVSGVVSSIKRRYEMQETTAGTVESSAVSSITGRYEMQEGLDVTLYSLQHEVSKIKSAINAARGRRITDQQLLEWLAQIINAAYLGEYYHRTFKNRSSLPPMIAGTEGTGNLLIDATSRPTKRQRTVRNLLFGNDEHRELHHVLKMLKSIDMCVFLQMVNALPERPMKRYLYMDHTWLIGRGKERDQVMKFLFEPSMAGENNVDVLPIVGSGGVGKTTLALHCFYDPNVQTHFSLKIYIYLPRICYSGSNRISESILYECNGFKKLYLDYWDENILLVMHKQNLSSERLLLVIDDIHNDDPDPTVWNALLGCLRCAKQGSKVIFASSSYNYTKHKIIRDAGTVKPIMLDGFSEDEYTLFFREHAFGSADPEDHPELAKIGEEIAKKMNGSIWGAKIIGELLRDNLNAPFWSIFLRDGFKWSKDICELCDIISQLLPKPLQVRRMSWGESGALLRYYNEVKSFRELMVLDPKHYTPSIENGENYGVPFLVAKHFDLYQCTDYIAFGEPMGDESKSLPGHNLVG